jgi:hypothetical protein
MVWAWGILRSVPAIVGLRPAWASWSTSSILPRFDTAGVRRDGIADHHGWGYFVFFLGGLARVESPLYAFFGDQASIKPVALDKFLTGAHTEGFKLYICSTVFMYE